MGTQYKNETYKKKSFLPTGKYAVLMILMSMVAIAFLCMMIVVNAFPKEITMAVIAVLVVMMILTGFLFKRKNGGLRALGVILMVAFVAVFGVGTYYLGSTFAAFARMSKAEKKAESTAGKNITEDAFNVYITGIDMWNKEKGLDLERSDVNMIVTVCPKTRRILLTSIPRDTYVMLHTAQQMDKLTHTGVYGVDETLNTVEDWLGFDMDYYVKVNFTSVVKIIYAIDGIDVESPKAFKSSISRYEYVKGMNHMGGRKALYFARERKAFKGEDAIRVENQQRVMKAVLDKLMTSRTLLTKYPDILKAGADDLETDMSVSEMQQLVKMQLADLGAWDIEMQKITGQYEMDYVASLAQTQQYLVYKPYSSAVENCRDGIEMVMNPTEEELAAIEEEKKKETAMKLFNKLLKRK